MQGFKTIIVNAVALLAGIAAYFGLDIGLEAQSAIVMTIMSIGGIILRLVTKTPVLKSE